MSESPEVRVQMLSLYTCSSFSDTRIFSDSDFDAIP